MLQFVASSVETVQGRDGRGKQAQMGTLLELLLVPVVRDVPLAVVVGLAVPLTALLSRHPLRLVGFGGAIVYSLDGAVLAFLLWTAMRTAVAAPGGGPGAWSLTLFVAAAWVPWLLGYVLAECTAHERRRVVRAYNIALSAAAGLLFVGLAVATRAALADLFGRGPATIQVGVWDLVAVVVGSAGYVGADLLLSAVFIARVEGGRVREVLADPAGLVAAGTVLAVNATAVLAAVLLTLSPWTLLLLVPVAAALVHATRTSTAALTEHARAQALYRGATGCQSATSAAEVLEAVATAAGAATAAPAVVAERPPRPDQVGGSFDDGGSRRWLVVGPRGNQHGFGDGDRTAVATLAALAEQSLARVGAMDRIRLVAEQDALTGVLDRGALLAVVARRAGPGSAVLFCDVDRFKAVNDTYGHRCGDQVLVHVATVLRDVVGAEGVVGRIGGDEFVVLLPSSDPGRTEGVRRAVLAAMQPAVQAGGHRLRVGLSIGVAAVADVVDHVPPQDRDALAEALLERADARMYDDKRAGRT